MSKIKHIILVACFCLGFGSGYAQYKIEFVSDNKLSELVEKHIAFNEKSNNISGYRLNIFFSSGNNSKSAAFEAKKRFETKYPDIGAYVVFETPNFKVKAGDFRNRSEARGFQLRIKGDFPNSFIIRDDINPMKGRD